MGFRKILSAFRVANFPFNVQQVPGDNVSQGSNTDLVCNNYGVLYTQDINSAPIGTPNTAFVLNAGSVGLGENVYPLHLYCMAGDPADTFATDPCYLQLHPTVSVLSGGEVPYMVWPVPIPPGMLVYTFPTPHTTGVTADIPGPFQLALSSTRNTFTAGPTGEIWCAFTSA